MGQPDFFGVFEGFAAGEGAYCGGVLGYVGLDGGEVGPGQGAEGPADALAYEEVGVGEVGVDAVEEEGKVGFLLAV